MGGLSILQALRAELPAENFVYVADSGHAPYGERDAVHVIGRSQAITRHLLAQHHIKALVVACNTATAAAIHLLRQQYPYALLLIAPRVPTRGAEALALCPEGTLQRSADPSALPGANASVYLADTFGELGLWYRLAPLALVGGSIAEVGGHNPHEPLALGCAVLHGPNVWNFSESYADLDAQGLSKIITNADDLAAAVHAHWQKALPRKPHRPHDPKIEAMVAQLDALLKS